jgi:hypothetical protein
MAHIVDQIHLHKRQYIVPPQWLGVYLRMCPKILQGHIFRVHLGLMQPQLLLPHLQAIYYGKDSFIMNRLSPLTTSELHALIKMVIQRALTIRLWQNHSSPYTSQKICRILRT